MKATMNPLDLLAEVAVSCKDDDKTDKPQQCEDLVKPEAEFAEELPSKDSMSSTTTPEESTSINNNIIDLSSTKIASGVEDMLEEAMEDEQHDELTKEDVKPVIQDTSLSVDAKGLIEKHGSEAEIDIQQLQNNPQPIVSDSATTTDLVTEESSEGDTESKCTCPKINNSVVCGSMCTSRAQPICSPSQLVHSTLLTKDSNKPAIVEHAYPAKKPPVDAAVTPTVSPPPTESLAQRVTRLLSPNFKLTMTDTIPSVLHNRNFSSLLIGNVGSATMRTALTAGRIFPHPVTVRPRTTITRKYPNISMSAIPVDHPLLDHDYCYQNYYEIVQAAAKLVKERNAKKKAIAKQEQKAAVDDGQPVKRKYRTKRIIAEEMKAEADRRAALKQRALDGDEAAQKELDNLELLDQEKELNAKKKGSKKKREVVIVEAADVDSDEEVMNEITEDIDLQHPVQDHNASFKDQFVYFGSKKYQSRSRHLNKAKDPYELFWTTGQLKTARAQTSVNNTQDQEIDDVLDVLGISPCDSQAGDEVILWPIDSNTTDSQSSTSSSTSGINAAVADSIVVGSSTSTNKNMSDTVRQQGCEKTVVQTNTDLGVGLDDLLQGITVDQVSELIQALNTEPSLESVGVATDATFDSATAPKASALTNGVPSLSSLATDVCAANDVQIPDTRGDSRNDNQSMSQQSQVSNISLDFTEADLLASDRSIDLELLNNLSSTPPRTTRPASLFLTPSSAMSSARLLPTSPNSPEKSASRSPMVVPVTMYWNTFPALLLDGVKYVRLIDISRQALPSKETGLLKKRAQSLGYEVITCTDLQRNLLVKYAFACPSRSNLMVSEAGAAEVIASYMEKSEMEELSKAPELLSQQPTKVKPATIANNTSSGALAEPVTLMPRVLIEHKPLQQSSHVGGIKTPSTCTTEPTAPERSSRLRQIKSSYRRFLPRTTSIATGSTAKADSSGYTGQEENASDRGYHSDQSPDSLMDRPVAHKRNHQPNKKGRLPKSARRSLSNSSANDIETEPCVETAMHTKPLSESVIEEVPLTDATPPSPNVSPAALEIDDDSGSLHKSQLENTGSEPMLNVMTKSEIVQIRHIDFVPKRNGKRTFQDGELYLEFFKSLHSPCIQCCNCRQFYTLRSFSKHQHTNRKLATVKIRQRTEPRGVSVGSELWQLFQKKKQLFEANRAPLKKLSETRLGKPSPLPAEGQINRLFHNSPTKLGKRIPKQKKYNPDEVYYSNPCIKNTSRKRQAEANMNADRKRSKSSDQVTNIKECINR